ncbi:antirestriction protein ArdA [Enterococcus hirae]
MNKECTVLVGTIDGKKQIEVVLPAPIGALMREFDGQEIVVLDCKFPIRVDEEQSLSELNEIAQVIQEMDQVYVNHLGEILDRFGCWVSGVKEIKFISGISDDEGLGNFVLEEDILPIPAEYHMYIDCQSLGRDVRYSSNLFYSSDGMFYKVLGIPF